MLPDAPSICRLQLDFMKWADDAMFGLIRGLDVELAERGQGVSFASISGTVQHIYRAERVWYRRVTGEPSAQIASVESPSLEELVELWPQHHEEWRRWALELEPNGWFQSILSKNSKGLESRLPYWQIVLHLVNHGTYHRGQIMSMVRQAGLEPVATDLIGYYRALSARM